MASKITCDYCGSKIDTVTAKYYRAPILPGKSQTSFMSAYSHWSDACEECDKKLITKMTRRKSRNGEKEEAA